MAITADKVRKTRANGQKLIDLVAVTTAQTVYIGALVDYVATTGRVRAAANTTSHVFAGMVEALVNETGSPLTAITGNTAGTVKVVISWGHEALVTIETVLRTVRSIGCEVFAKDNDTVTDTTGAGTAGVRVRVGTLTARVGTTQAWVALRRRGGADAA
jgi:hypothetical protein